MSPLTSVSASRIEQLPGQIQKLVDVRNGQKHATARKFFPAYVLAKMELTERRPTTSAEEILVYHRRAS
jgi:transcription antitermination factor NusG